MIEGIREAAKEKPEIVIADYRLINRRRKSKIFRGQQNRGLHSLGRRKAYR
jgi:hypothetical protein